MKNLQTPLTKWLDPAEAYSLIQHGKIIAYPTEAVYGLGCDPWNEAAVKCLLTLKQRPVEKGLLLIIAHWSQLPPLIQEIPEDRMTMIRQTWPGPVTWVFPKSAILPLWLTGKHSSIAIRMTAHPIARTLCLETPLISTSANITGKSPARTINELCEQFPDGIDAIVSGALGGALHSNQNRPSQIRDALTGEILRE